MSTRYSIQSSDPLLLQKAGRIAEEYARQYVIDEIEGIVFLGAIIRGYFDTSADIDIALFKKQSSEILLPSQFVKVEGIEVHCHLTEYESELNTEWNMTKRWTYSQRQIYYDPDGKILQLLEEKVPLKTEEKKWLLMSGIILSEWYINRLTQTWVERGNHISAHHMIEEGLRHFFNVLFAINNQLVPDAKWRYFCAEKLSLLPVDYQERIRETMMIQSFSDAELERRKEAFMGMWQEMLPKVEQKVQMSYDEILPLV